MTAATPEPYHYRRPGWFTRNVLNRAVAGLTRSGVSVLGSRVLEVTGRKSGAPPPARQPAHLRRRRLSGGAEGGGGMGSQRPGGRRTADAAARPAADERTATEVLETDKVPVLRAYLKRWKAEVGVFFDGVGPDSTDEELGRHRPRPPGVQGRRGLISVA